MIRVPLTLAILPTLLVQAGEAVYALPLARVQEVLHAAPDSLGWFDGRRVLDRHTHTLPLIDLRWKHAVVGVAQEGNAVTLQVQTPDGSFALQADHVIACDGARSSVRQLIGQEAKGRTFKDRFLIADVKMAADFPAERWFWFDPPFHPGYSALLHKQPDDVWRIDFQLGVDADPDHEGKLETVTPRLKAMLGEEIVFDYEWLSVYSFSCRCMDSFTHGRVLFAGDAAHVVSPFGARGGNSGVADADNLVWKLALVLRGAASVALLDSYSQDELLERIELLEAEIERVRAHHGKKAAHREAADALFGKPS